MIIICVIAGCRFKYRSSARRNGTISSPNYPGLYPRNTECTYVFVMKLQERVTVTFRRFDIEGIMPKWVKRRKPKLRCHIISCIILYNVSQKHPRYHAVITLPNVGRFSQFFHLWIQQKVCNKIFSCFPPNLKHVTTLNPKVKEIWKSAIIWQSYDRMTS